MENIWVDSSGQSTMSNAISNYMYHAGKNMLQVIFDKDDIIYTRGYERGRNMTICAIFCALYKTDAMEKQVAKGFIRKLTNLTNAEIECNLKIAELEKENDRQKSE